MRSAYWAAPRLGHDVAGIVICAVVLSLLNVLPAYSAEEGTTPSPVSGRSLSDPEGVLAADVLARVELLRANVDLVRNYMGKLDAPDPILRVEGAEPHEVYLQAINLHHGAERLLFDQVRAAGAEVARLQGEARAVDVFEVVDSSLSAVLVVKRHLGIHEVIAERPHPGSTTPSEVFNMIVMASSEIDHLLDSTTTPSDVFMMVTGAVHSAAAMHAALSDGPYLPREPAFEPNKMPADIYLRLQVCFAMVGKLAAAAGIETLSFDFDEERASSITPYDVSSLAALVVAELDHLHRADPDVRPTSAPHYPGRRYPSNVYQRAGLLELLLQDLIDASENAASVSTSGD